MSVHATKSEITSQSPRLPAPQAPPVPGTSIAQLAAEVDRLRREMTAHEAAHATRLAAVHPSWRRSATNLLHYLALRARDLRPLQRRLAALGLSSLGRSESHALATIEAVATALARLTGRERGPDPSPSAVHHDEGEALLRAHAACLLGVGRPRRAVRIMVTLPPEAADDPDLVRDLIAGGMDCARINCAHDDPAAWARMVGHVRDAARAAGRACRVLMDLGGPKVRTGAIDPSGQVVKCRPERNASGAVNTPALLWIAAAGAPCPPRAAAALEVSPAALPLLRPGHALELRDLRGKRRLLRIAEVRADGCLAAVEKSLYLRVGDGVELRGAGVAGGSRTSVPARVGAPPRGGACIVLHRGDRLLVTYDDAPGRTARLDADGRVAEPARISCSLGEAVRAAKPGDAVWFDDGKIGGEVEDTTPNGVLVQVTRAPEKGARLRADKGINFPGSAADCPALTAQDRADLDFVARHADLVGLSFLGAPRDIAELRAELERRSAGSLGIVLKIETERAFHRLPELLLEAMRCESVGVMIARGDLAIECGYERLAEVQEEILWLCEAAHVPVVWATQVLESLAKTGFPSRAEVTDAAMGERAECVMLNKGPFLGETVRTLDDILRRMQAHQEKKSAMLRRLEVSALPLGD